MKPIVVGGVIANQHDRGSAVWTWLNWTLGLRKLGFDAYFVEQIDPAHCVDEHGAPAPIADSANLAVFRRVMREFGMEKKCALISGEREVVEGLAWEELLALAHEAEALVNISGHLTSAPLIERFRRKVYVDLDPGFTQIWQATGVTGSRLEGHDFHFTIGENIGQPDCLIPTAGIEWRATCQPVVLDLWPVTEPPSSGRFRTISSWRGPFGRVEYAGRSFGLKMHEWRKVLTLPELTGQEFEIALAIHPAETKDLEALAANGWKIVDPKIATGDPATAQEYVRASRAEFSAAQGVYADTNSGWVSDRTVCYLAAGRPALVQETGMGRLHPASAGLLRYRTVEEAAAAVREIVANYREHCRAAREIAERDFDSDKVLGRLAEQIGIQP
jgi:hypothetical protein